ncbi:uncharacterized protein LOC112564619 isoform X2 [Pomacea canaliculata]|uniref:uncharacterized protein LOC112564619 isoform X2 n=1 Tax=Pomacea canaliculata TaxID=400727 RepID=UPI000D736027|nr:uncharacterized protein LOC112564619 isoform X2 [Pomacea canaliculata]
MNSITQGVCLSPDICEPEKNRGDLVDQLEEFPHSFLMTDLQNKSKSYFERIKEGLVQGLKVGFKTTLETARAKNLLSYSLFLLGYPDEAIEEIDRALALEDQQTNIVSLANKAFIWISMDYYDQAQEQILVLQKLKTHSDFQYLETKAKGELAFSYTRMGPPFIPKTIKLFEEVLPKAREEEKFLWSFGLALTYRRAMHGQNIEVVTAIDNQEKSERTLNLLKYIIRESTSKNLQAKAYSELALLLNQNKTNESLNLEAGMSIEEACNKALELDKDDYSVLVKTGRLFRYLKETERSRQVLETAVSIRPSSTVFHHLGLTYKALATDKIYEGSLSGTPGRGSSRGTWNRGRGGGWRGRGGRGRMSEGTGSGQISDGAHARAPNSMIVRENSDKVYNVEVSAGLRGGSGRTRGNIPDDRPFTNRSYTHDRQHTQERATSCYSSLEGGERPFPYCKEKTTVKEDNFIDRFGMMSLDINNPRKRGSLRKNYAHNEDARLTDTLAQKRLGRMVKSPNGNETKFSRSDSYIPEALHYLEEAVKFSKDENKRAVYDLALLHKALGEYDNALILLQKIKNSTSMMVGAFDKVNAWEQIGLIWKTKSENETNEEEKKKLDKRGNSMLRSALHEAMRLFSRAPSMQQQVCHVWNSFSTLLADIENSDGNTREKIREKARLLTLVSKHKESISLLQELKTISPQKENDPETLKLLIENYSGTKDYESAAFLIDLLKCSSEGNPTMSLFGDKYYTQKVYIKAAEQHLMTSCDKLEPTFDLARRFFRAAFTDIISESSVSSESWETGSSSDSEEADEWHVMILYDDRDEDMEKYANSLKSLLGDACSLGVTCMYEDVMPGMKRDGLLRNMKRSQLLIFIAGEKVSRNLTYFMEIAAERQSTVTLLVNTQKIPRLLSKRRNRPFPTEFLDFTAGSYTPDTVNAVCSLFRFLIGIGEG